MGTTSTWTASLDELIGAIYDCVIDPSRWADTLERIRRRYHFHNATLAVHSAVSNEVVTHVVIGVPDAYLPMLDGYGLDVIKMWGGWERIVATPLEEPLVQSRALGQRDWNDNAYYREFTSPQGISDAMAIALARDATTVASVAFGRHHAAPVLTDAELDELRILAPHLRRAVVISRLLETSMAAAASFADALDAAPSGVVLVDRRRHVVHANGAAAAMLAAADPIRATPQLELASEVVSGAFARAIETAGEAEQGGRGRGVPARRLNGEPLTVQVMPLERQHGANTPLPAVAAVFIAEAGAPPTSAEILAVLFDLTPAESRIFTLIVNGGQIPDIAAQLSISPATAKTHLSRIYHKTGQKSRAGLVRLAQDLAPPG